MPQPSELKIVIYGSHGAGKTALSVALAKLLTNNGYQVVLDTGEADQLSIERWRDADRSSGPGIYLEELKSRKITLSTQALREPLTRKSNVSL